jgi:predicted hydrocarbon binding protein
MRYSCSDLHDCEACLLTLSKVESRPRPLDELSRDEERGWILEDGRRIISFRLTTFQALINELHRMTGAAVAEVLLHRLGAAIGDAGMSYLKEQVHSTEELKEVMDKYSRTRGWGRCLSIEERKDAGKTTYMVACKGTPFSYERNAAQPTCHMMRGLVVGCLQTYLGRKAERSAETQCMSTGSQACLFEVVFSP